MKLNQNPLCVKAVGCWTRLLYVPFVAPSTASTNRWKLDGPAAFQNRVLETNSCVCPFSYLLCGVIISDAMHQVMQLLIEWCC